MPMRASGARGRGAPMRKCAARAAPQRMMKNKKKAPAAAMPAQ